MIIEVRRMRTSDDIQVETAIDGVPYYGTGTNLREALNQLVDVLRDHGAPVPGRTWELR